MVDLASVLFKQFSTTSLLWLLHRNSVAFSKQNDKLELCSARLKLNGVSDSV